MKPPRHRLDFSSYPLTKRVPTRLGDVNGARHVSNVAVAGIYEDARGDLLIQVRGGALFSGDENTVMAQATLTYLAEILHPSDLIVATGIARVGRTSFELAQGIFLNGECVGLSDAVIVNVKAGQPTPLSDNARALLSSYFYRAEIIET